MLQNTGQYASLSGNLNFVASFMFSTTHMAPNSLPFQRPVLILSILSSWPCLVVQDPGTLPASCMSSFTKNSLNNQCDNSEPRDVRRKAPFRMGQSERWKDSCLLMMQEPYTQSDLSTYPMCLL